MYDKLERNDSLVGWMIAGGARYDEPDTRYIEHLIALRDAKRDAGRSRAGHAFSPLAWLTARLAPKATVSASAGGTASAVLPAASTTCCASA